MSEQEQQQAFCCQHPGMVVCAAEKTVHGHSSPYSCACMQALAASLAIVFQSKGLHACVDAACLLAG